MEGSFIVACLTSVHAQPLLPISYAGTAKCLSVPCIGGLTQGCEVRNIPLRPDSEDKADEQSPTPEVSALDDLV
jgi:hypothetical protein